MQCMKCGREIPAGQVFCQECLTEMEAYPVKPGTVVTLPTRPNVHPVKKPMFYRPTPTLEERVKTMGKVIRVLSWTLTLTAALLIGVSALAISMLQEDQTGELPGQNYSAEGETKDPPEWNIDRFGDDDDETTEGTSEGRQNLNGLLGN